MFAQLHSGVQAIRVSPWLPGFVSSRRHRSSILLATAALATILRQRVLVEPSWIWLEITLISVAAILLAYRVAVVASGSMLIIAPAVMLFATRMESAAVAAELTMLTTLGTSSLAIGLMANKSRGQSIAIVAAGFLMLFTTAVGDEKHVTIYAVLWLTLCVWYLITNHWERLELRSPDKVTRNFTMKPVTLLLAWVALLLGGAFSYGRFGDSNSPVNGFMPTSGGSRWSDSQSREGVGTGEIAIAGKEQPNSFGPVDSDWLLESQESTLYDMFSESAGKPKIPKTHEMRQDVASKQFKQTHQHLTKSERGNGSFSVQRDLPPPPAKDFKDHRVNAVLQWAGAAGIRLAMRRYTEFDGVYWSPVEGDSRRIKMPSVVQDDRTWFGHPGLFRFLKRDASPFISRLKVLRLADSRIPAPGQTAAVHIKDVIREDFFRVEPDGSWSMPGREKIPPLTVLQLCELTMWEDELVRNIDYSDRRKLYGAEVSQKIEDLLGSYIETWATDSDDPYERLRLCLSGLRDEFAFDRYAEHASEDSLLGFLQSRRGGDHLFATTAALIGRKLGLRTRLVTGFYVPQRMGDLATGATNVRKEDVHAWVEVALCDGRWFEIEPTPGYRPPVYQASLWLRTKRFATAYWRHMLLGSFTAFGLFLARRIWLEWMLRAVWILTAPLAPGRRVKVAMWVIESRALLAGVKRIAGRPQRDWLMSFFGGAEPAQASISRFCDFADRVTFGNRTSQTIHPDELAAIGDVVSLLGMKELQTYQKNKGSK